MREKYLKKFAIFTVIFLFTLTIVGFVSANCSCNADIAVTKSDSPDPIIAGNQLTYTINVVNNGPATINALKLTDNLPAGFTVTNITPSGGIYDPVTHIWSGITLTSGNQVTLTIRGTVDPEFTGDSLTNTVTVYPCGLCGVTDSNTDNNQDTTITRVIRESNLIVTKNGNPDPVTAGNQLTYNMSVHNNGPSVAYNISFVDNLPAALTGAEYSLNNINWTSYTGQNVLLGDINVAQTVNFWIRGLVDPNTLPGSLHNVVDVFINGTWSGQAINDTTVTNVAPLSITKTADKSPAEYNVGDKITYTIRVSNSGPSTAHNVVVTDAIPNGLQYDISSNGGSYNEGIVTWNAGDLVSGAQITRTVTVTVLPEAAAIRNIKNTATAQHDYMESPISTEATVKILSSNLELTKTVDNPKPYVKETVHFTLIVNNHGPDTAVNVLVAEKLPDGLSYVSYTANKGIYDPDTGIWSIANLPKGASAEITITSVVEKSGIIINEAKVRSIIYDPNLDDNSANATINAQLLVNPNAARGDKGNTTNGNKVNAADYTVPMQETGLPVTILILALMAVLGGLTGFRR